jgi:hypothetical protein
MIKRKKLWMAGGDGEEKEREALVWENGGGQAGFQSQFLK